VPTEILDRWHVLGYITRRRSRSPTCSVTGETFDVAGGFVSRMAIVNTAGFHDPELTVETVAELSGEVMAVTPDARPQVVAVPVARAS
jgi:hypothetical protein